MSLSTWRTGSLVAGGEDPLVALNEGFQLSFAAAAAAALAAAVIGGALLRPKPMQGHQEPELVEATA